MKEGRTGLVIRLGNMYVRTVFCSIMNAPRVELTSHLEEARVWRSPKGARQARARMGGGGRILVVENRGGQRTILGQMGRLDAQAEG